MLTIALRYALLNIRLDMAHHAGKKSFFKQLQYAHIVFFLLFAVLFGIVASRSTPQGINTRQVEAINTGPEGKVNFFNGHDSSFDQYTKNPDRGQKRWISSHYLRMQTYSPYFDSRIFWYSGAWLYKDSYAIYNPSDLANEHPEWILRDKADGNKLYIPYNCSNSSCPQYAADIGNPAYRSYWIDSIKKILSKYRYVGIFVDDVNMSLKVSNGDGSETEPYDPRTGTTMTLADWRKNMADFMLQIKQAFPSHEIVQNQVYFLAPFSDSSVQQAVKAADFIEMERGFLDLGIDGGNGKYGFETYLSFIDYYHSVGKGVVLDTQLSNADQGSWGQEYSLATYYLISTGRDMLGNKNGGLPNNWWKGYETNLGIATSARYKLENNVYRRDFEKGIVLVNPPEESEKTITLDTAYINLAGREVTSVVLKARTSAVLKKKIITPTTRR